MTDLKRLYMVYLKPELKIFTIMTEHPQNVNIINISYFNFYLRIFLDKGIQHIKLCQLNSLHWIAAVCLKRLGLLNGHWKSLKFSGVSLTKLMLSPRAIHIKTIIDLLDFEEDYE